MKVSKPLRLPAKYEKNVANLDPAAGRISQRLGLSSVPVLAPMADGDETETSYLKPKTRHDTKSPRGTRASVYRQIKRTLKTAQPGPRAQNGAFAKRFDPDSRSLHLR